MPAPYVPFYKKALSYLYPVRIKHARGTINEVLEIYLYCGQWQLATSDALYSDGNRYRPLVAAFKYLKNKLPQVSNVLVLGAGLGSAITILNGKGYHPQVTLVDIDKQVLKWALEFANEDALPYVTPICDDASRFIVDCRARYDMVIVDVFKGRHVPPFVTGTPFLENIRRCVNKGGCVILNYIINNEEDWGKAQQIFDNVFPGHHVINLDINRILIATV